MVPVGEGYSLGCFLEAAVRTWVFVDTVESG
jgi:hypothetical protein